MTTISQEIIQQKYLLQQVYNLNQKYNAIAEVTGENYNIFEILGVGTLEVKTHSAFLANLLDPNGTHGCKDVFLNLFVQLLKRKQHGEAFPLEEFNSSQAFAETETYAGFIDDEYTQGGFLDILCSDNQGQGIIIENKIYAGDQKNQLTRYHHYAKRNLYNGHLIIYLTLAGNEPGEMSVGKLNKDERFFITLSYKEDILFWLETCHKEASQFPILRETIVQYIHLIRNLTEQAMNNKMEQELISNVLSSKANIAAAAQIAGAWDNIQKAIMAQFKQELERINWEEKYNLKLHVNEDLGKKDNGFWFYRDNWKHCIYFYFSSKFETIEYGIDNIESDNGIGEKEKVELSTKLASIGETAMGWIWGGIRFSVWENTAWEDVSETIPAEVEEIVKRIMALLDNEPKLSLN